MPTTQTVTFSNLKLEPAYDPDLARTRAVAIKASQNIARGTILGEVTASPGTYAPYATGNSDGTQNAKAIAVYDMQTDASKNITLSSTSAQAGGAFGETFLVAPVYVCGAFKSSELTGLDADGVTALMGKFESGNITDGGIFRF